MRELLSRARFGPDGAFNLSTLHIGDVLAEVRICVRGNLASFAWRTRHGEHCDDRTMKILRATSQVTTLVRLNHVKIDPTFTTLVMAIGVLEG